jgi:OmpA-OmpF porin, OOP family
MKTILFIAVIFLALPSIAQSNKNAPLLVRVMNNSKQPIPFDKIIFKGRTNKKTIIGVTGVNGAFNTSLPVGDIYDVEIDAIGEQLEYNSIEIPTIPDNAEYGVMELFILYDMPEMFTLSNLQFETGKSTIKSTSYASLNQLAEFLIRKKTQKILIAGHTDNVGDPAANNMLSLDRAESVKKYLINKGVPIELLKAKGYGDTKPIADNSEEAGRAINRRTEIHVVK